MKTENTFALRPLTTSLKWMTLMPLMLVSTHSFGEIVDNGESAVIGGNNELESYVVRNKSSLTANGARTTGIRVETESFLTLDGTVVTSSGSSIGVDMVDSKATISASTITGTSTGFSIGRTTAVQLGSSVTATSSIITGGTVGAVVGGLSQLDLDQTTLTGTNGFGLQLANGRVSATSSTIQGGINGILLTTDQAVQQPGRVVLDRTTVQGQTLLIFIDDSVTILSADEAAAPAAPALAPLAAIRPNTPAPTPDPIAIYPRNPVTSPRRSFPVAIAATPVTVLAAAAANEVMVSSPDATLTALAPAAMAAPAGARVPREPTVTATPITTPIQAMTPALGFLGA